MRQIKFRAWDITSKRWHSSALSFAIGEMSERAEQQGFILMQFTGLKDKNGKEIYEADLVKHPSYPTPLRVEWDYDQWGLFDGICNEASLNGECEVIGNIYEQPSKI